MLYAIDHVTGLPDDGSNVVGDQLFYYLTVFRTHDAQNRGMTLNNVQVSILHNILNTLTLIAINGQLLVDGSDILDTNLIPLLKELGKQ